MKGFLICWRNRNIDLHSTLVVMTSSKPGFSASGAIDAYASIANYQVTQRSSVGRDMLATIVGGANKKAEENIIVKEATFVTVE